MLRQPSSEEGTSTDSPEPVTHERGELLIKSPHDTSLNQLALLLHAAAGIEHELMVQYLYAAYSLGLDQIPADKRNDDQRLLVQLWQRNLLAIAKEEMGHFLTVQNVLTVLGLPTLWGRGSYPADNEYFPLRRQALSPLTMASLSCYVYAEAPANTAAVADRYWGMPVEEVNQIIAEVSSEVGGSPHRVGQLYKKIVEVIQDPRSIPDSAFHAETFATQAWWEEWGKGYKPFEAAPESPSPGAYAPPEPGSSSDFIPWTPLIPATSAEARVIVSRVATRTEVLAALKLIGEQGEAPDCNPENDEPSHFDRFINIYRRFKNESKTWTPARNVPNNPTTRQNPLDGTYIESEHSRNWAHLFNLRYHMLLMYLAHTYLLPPATDPRHPQMRAGTLHRVFSEMYNLRGIANILVRLPLTDGENDPRRAGPPFELPHTLNLPADVKDRWRLHRELLVNSEILCQKLLPDAPPEGRQYLSALRDLDRQSIAWLDAVIDAPGPARGSRS